jgi:hypothetical protein
MAEQRGRCFCGSVTWVYSGDAVRNLVCHCADCQRATSSPFTAFIGLNPAHLRWSGAIANFESSPATFRGFCPNCGTRLYFKSERWPDEIHVHAATLEDPAAYQPTAQVMTRSRAPWLGRLPELPSFSGFEKAPAENR